MSQCRFCGHRNPAGADACEECGAKFLDRDRRPAVELGDDFEQRLLGFVADAFRAEHGIDLRRDEMALPRLREACRKARQELESAESTDINLPFVATDASGPKHLQISVSRSQFDHAHDESDRIIELLRSGQKIAAIKLYRERHGTGLKEAKDAVEDLARQHQIIAPGGSGCAGVAVLLLIAGATLAGMIL